MLRVLFAVSGILALAGSSALAHHSYADFHRDQTVSIEGELVEMLFANPHVELKIRTKDSHIYKAVWDAPHALHRRGFIVREVLKVGDVLVVSGAPSRDPEVRTLAMLTEVRRPSDGWRYERVPNGSVGTIVKP